MSHLISWTLPTLPDLLLPLPLQVLGALSLRSLPSDGSASLEVPPVKSTAVQGFCLPQSSALGCSHWFISLPGNLVTLGTGTL